MPESFQAPHRMIWSWCRRASILAFVLVASACASAHTPAAPPARSAAGVGASAATPSGDDPYQIGGTAMTLSQAEANMPFKLVLPETSLANDGNMTGVWATKSLGDASQIALQYQGGAVWVIEYPTQNSSAKAESIFLSDASDFNGSLGRNVFAVEEVSGIPLLVGQPNMDYDRNAPASVGSVSDGTDVTFYSNSLTIDDLLGVATAAWGVQGQKVTELQIPAYTPPPQVSGAPSPISAPT